MDPIKIIGGLLVALGCVFRAISLAYFAKRAKSLPGDSPRARRLFEGRRQRALVIDALFVVLGFYLILTK